MLPANVTLWPVKYEDQLPRAFWRRALSAGLLLAGIFAALLPFVGPLLDHHYAQFQPHHGHIHLGGSGDGHDHVHLRQPHSHESGETSLFAATGTFSVPASGDWSPQKTWSPVVMLIVLPLAVFQPGTGQYGRLAPPTLQARDELFLPPPEKPPRS